MGLDAVEIILRVEEFYSTSISDEEAAQVRTIGDLYRLVCSKLSVTPLDAPQTSPELPRVTEFERSFVILRKPIPLPPPSNVLPWTPQSIWDCLVAIVADQLVVEANEVVYGARFVEDLGVD